MHLVRLCKRSHAQLDGIGAGRTGGRWNSIGKPVVYTASTASLALLEYLVHLSHLPDNMVLLYIEVPDTLTIDHADFAHPELSVTRQIGDNWFDARETAVLRVPSVIVPGEFNYVLHPQHSLFPSIQIKDKSSFALDPRLLGKVHIPKGILETGS